MLGWDDGRGRVEREAGVRKGFESALTRPLFSDSSPRSAARGSPDLFVMLCQQKDQQLRILCFSAPGALCCSDSYLHHAWATTGMHT